MASTADIVALREPAALPRADVAPLKWAASAKLEIAARLAHEAIEELALLLRADERALLFAHANALETAAQIIVSDAIGDCA